MSTPASFKYYHPGVLIPTLDVSEEDQWSEDPLILRDGVVFIGSIKFNKVFSVQSRGTGEILINKVYNVGEWPGTDDEDLPLELRVSTAPISGYRRLPRPIVVDGVKRILFNELVAWQRIRDGENAIYSLYFRYCNGGTLQQLIEKYTEWNRPVPEHFVWLVAERLATAIRFLMFGMPPGSHDEPEDWEYISHRDLVQNNIFIHYHPRRPGRRPNIGLETNAFPEVIVGDFGEANMENDPEGILSNAIIAEIGVRPWDDMVCTLEMLLLGVFLEEFLKLLHLQWLTYSTSRGWSKTDWHIRYFMGETLRLMVQAHIPLAEDENEIDRPNQIPVNTVNNRIAPPDTPYSEELIELLEHFEFPNSEDLVPISETIQDEDGNTVPLSDYLPTAEWIVDTMLPLARRKVRRYRGIGRKPVGYFDALDVSWTKPERIMPFSYTHPPGGQDAGNTHNGGLRAYTNWNHIAPNHTSFQYRNPAFEVLPTSPPAAPLPPPPPGGDSDVESTPDPDSDNDSDNDGPDGPDPDEDRTGNYRPGNRSWNP
ncbi:hypothetical protein F4813DRAFT_401031 [Daldinia decipiens]|uniref:uncharacterized protein n=1 Tax=Daldinia decipiens TaxID=326647 RepID=UPI0020C1E5C2|nr:uncharacterized protein F4813DRAFT_401031 [Daldinia decipiens]KAI1660020.1 hypothetical protein F4813DRAFT_401031 [Daldinia decipiens]